MPPEPDKNIDWISNLKWIAMYAVIVLHCTAPLLMQYGKISAFDYWTADIFNAAVRFAVPVFVMITGALLLHRDEETGIFLKKRLGRVVFPFLFWSLVYIWYSWYNEDITFGNHAWENLRLVFHLLKNGSSYHLWYVYMLIGLYFFIPVLGKFVRHASENDLVYFLLVWIGVMVITQPYLVRFNPAVDMHYFLGYAGYLVLGHYLASKNLNITRPALCMLAIFIGCVGFIAVGSSLVVAGSKYPGTMFYEPLNPLVMIASASLFMLIKVYIPKVPPVVIKLRDFAGKYNYGIYLSHALVLYFLDDLSGISYKTFSPLLSIPLTALICFGISLLLVWTISKLPFGKWISG